MSNETKRQEVLNVLNGMSDEEQASVLVDLVKETLAKLPRLQHEVPEEPKHYYCSNRSKEESDAFTIEYETTPGGKGFAKRLEKSVDFLKKAKACSLTCAQVNYLADKHYNNFLNGSFDLYALGFKAGADYQKRKARVEK